MKDKIQELILSGEETSFELAFQLALGQGIAEETLVHPWAELIKACFGGVALTREHLWNALQLKHLSLSGKNLERLLAKLFELKQLKKLFLQDFEMDSLPEAIGNLQRLKSLSSSF